MFSEKNPLFDPLTIGHRQADKKIEQEKTRELEKKADEIAEEERKAAEERQKDLDDTYADSDVMSDIFPSWQK